MIIPPILCLKSNKYMLKNNCIPVLPWNHKDISDENSAVRNSQCRKGREVSDPMVTVLTYSICWHQNRVCKQPWCKASQEKCNETNQVSRNIWRMANNHVKHVSAMWKYSSKLYIRDLEFTLRATLPPFTGEETESPRGPVAPQWQHGAELGCGCRNSASGAWVSPCLLRTCREMKGRRAREGRGPWWWF